MSAIGFFIILIAEYMFALELLEFFLDSGIIYAAVLFIVSLLIVYFVCLIRRKKSESVNIWELFKKISPVVIAIEIILMNILRLWIVMSI